MYDHDQAAIIAAEARLDAAVRSLKDAQHHLVNTPATQTVMTATGQLDPLIQRVEDAYARALVDAKNIGAR